MSAFSFDYYKIITAGEGGAVPPMMMKARNIPTMVTTISVKQEEQNPGINRFGTFRGSEAGAAVVLAQLRSFPYMIEKQKVAPTYF